LPRVGNNVAGFLIEPALDQQLEFSDGSLSVISYPRYHQLCPFSGGQHQEPQNTFAVDPLAVLLDPDIRSVFVGHSDKHGCQARMQAKLILNSWAIPLRSPPFANDGANA
jgi:hypothetical protein